MTQIHPICLTLIVVVAACSSSKSESTSLFCSPGDTQICTGPNGCRGGQQCAQDGSSWSACDCGPTLATGGASTSDSPPSTGGATLSGNSSSTNVGGTAGAGARGATGGIAVAGSGGSLGTTGTLTGGASTGGATAVSVKHGKRWTICLRQPCDDGLGRCGRHGRKPDLYLQ